VGGCGTSTALPPGQHFNRMDLLMFIRSIASCFVLLSACHSDRPDPPTGREAVIAELESCGLHGRFEVGPVTGETGCEGAPTEGGVVEVSVASDGAIRLAVGGFELPATLTSCRLEASACTRETDSTSSIETYRAIDAALERTHASLAIERASGAGTFSSSCATDASFSLAPIAAPSGCDPTGTFVADADAPIEGACDLAWPMGVVEVRRDPDGTFTVDWAGTEIDGLVLDEASCSLRGSRGESSGTSIDLWSYNGAMRTVMLALALEGDVLVGTASDRLEGETFDGLSCAGGTFRLSASRETAAVERFEAACAIERPVICGDRMCEAERGESCTCGDCTCGAGTECVPATGACLRGCTSPADACGAGQRCSIPGEGRLDAGARLFCVAAGDKLEGERCIEHNECAGGLICHYDSDRPALTTDVGLCLRPCTESSPTCERCAPGDRSTYAACTSSCSRAMPDGCAFDDAFCWNRFTLEESGVCVAEPEGGLGRSGDTCDFESRQVQCEPSFGCVSSCRGSDCVEVCAPVCSSAADCPAEFPRCVLSGSTGKGFCFPP
jgi:hypothetical protein